MMQTLNRISADKDTIEFQPKYQSTDYSTNAVVILLGKLIKNVVIKFPRNENKTKTKTKSN